MGHTPVLPRASSSFQSWKSVRLDSSPESVCTKRCPCQDIPSTISALSSTGDMKGALCAASCSMANWLLSPFIKCTVYLIFHSVFQKPLKPRGLSSYFWQCFFTRKEENSFIYSSLISYIHLTYFAFPNLSYLSGIRIPERGQPYPTPTKVLLSD